MAAQTSMLHIRVDDKLKADATESSPTLVYPSRMLCEFS